MSILVQSFMLFRKENSNVVEMIKKKIDFFKKIHFSLPLEVGEYHLMDEVVVAIFET